MTVPPALQRLAALTLLLLLPVLVWLAVVEPLLALRQAQRDEIETLGDAIRRYQALAAEGPALGAQLASLQARADAHSGFLRAATPVLAASEVQARVRLFVEDGGGLVRSVQSLPPAEVEGLERIALRYDLSLPQETLAEVLYQIETSEPYLFVETLSLNGPELSLSQARIEDEAMLAVRWTVHGYRWTRQP